MELNFREYFQPESPRIKESAGVFPVVMLYEFGHMTDTGNVKGREFGWHLKSTPPTPTQ